jgi:hypothetical protein
MFRFKNFGAKSPSPAAVVAHAHLSLPSKDDNKHQEENNNNNTMLYNVGESVTESMYNMNLGVYHENEMAGQATLSPALNRRSQMFKKKKQRQPRNKAFRRSFLGEANKTYNKKLN